ncbi:MAG TPA: citramalate synthase [Firmicutes bacterium]|jgi:2-isopropylmalate synthase|nr:citramalate synthase [Bacillota bacterium]
MKKFYIYDTTLRDGAQREGISFSVSDKLEIVKLLDSLGVDYIEGGWPGSNPKDIEFFDRLKGLTLKHAKVSAFGSTRRAHIDVDADENIKAILEAKTPAVAIVGKSWDFHVTQALGTTLEENLSMIADTVAYLKEKGLEVIFDAEHFFDGFFNNPDYALQTIRTAAENGADAVVLCDTNGGTMPLDVKKIIQKVKKVIDAPLGIHAHNDCGMGVANSIIALQSGAVHVQGTINGYGERCGNADLCCVIPNMYFKLGIKKFKPEQLKELTRISKVVAELANMIPLDGQPYVGRNAFTHKGGIHVDAVVKHASTYEHANPEEVGNKRRILVSELSGKSSILSKAREEEIQLIKNYPEAKEVLQAIKKMEHEGYQFEGAEGSFELLIWKTLKTYNPLFKLEGFRVILDKERRGSDLYIEATIKLTVGNRSVHTVAEGNGPVNALDNALRKALEEIYPEIKNIKLIDYKVRVLDGKDGTGAKVRVLITSQDGNKRWGTVGVSENIIEASWVALVDSIEYGLLCKQSPAVDDFKKAINDITWEEEYIEKNSNPSSSRGISL